MEADRNGAADDAMADIQFNKMGNREKRGQVLIIQAVPSVDPEPQAMCLLRAGDEPLQLGSGLSPGAELFRKSERPKDAQAA